MKLLTINVDTGSPTGFHYWQSWIRGCPRRRYLEDLRAKAGLPKVGTENENLMTGSVWHGFMRLFFEGNRTFDTAAVRFAQSRGRIWTPSERARKAGADLFRAFRARYKPDVFGKVTAVERPFRVSKAPWLPKGMVLTGRTDLEVEVSSRAADSIERDFGVRLPTGHYLVDHKSAGSARHLDSYNWELQFTCYMAARVLTRKNLRGMLVNVGIKSNPPDYKLLHIGFPGENEIAVLRGFLSEAFEMSQRRPAPMLGPCYDYFDAGGCIFGRTGECPRR